ncbi:MAG: HAD hydrolase-like protein [Clostridia bacterium]|nr:HAD hydrolase-like protein [Clostridia bacterium]
MAKKYNTVFFDLDGTIIDSGEGVSNSVLYALEKFGIKETKENALKFIGPPLAHSFKQFYGFSDEKATQGIEIYREYYREKGIFECYIYQGIEELLCALKKNGYKVVLCTSKPEKYAQQILNHFGIMKYFDHACGATMDEKTRATKDDVMKYAFKVSGAKPDSTIMIGDRMFDINSANKFGLDSIGVTFGYGSQEELKTAGATYIAGSCNEIKELLIG